MPPKTPRDSSNEKNNKEELPQSQGTRVLRDRNPKPATSQGLPSSSSNQFSATNKGTGSGGDIGVFKRPREILDRDLKTRRQKLIKTLQNAEKAAEIPDFETHLRDQVRAKELNEDDQEEIIAVANKAVGGSNKFKADVRSKAHENRCMAISLYEDFLYYQTPEHRLQYREEFDKTKRIKAKPMRKGLPPAILTEDAKYDKKLRPFIDLFEQDNVGATEEIDYEKMGPNNLHVGLPRARRFAVGLGRPRNPRLLSPIKLPLDIEAIERRRREIEDAEGDQSLTYESHSGRRKRDLELPSPLPITRGSSGTHLESGLHIAARETSFDWKTSYDKRGAVAPGRTLIMPAKPTLELQGDELNEFSKPPMTPIEYNASVGHHHVETTSWAEATNGRRERAKEETMNRMPESDLESSDEDSSDDEGDEFAISYRQCSSLKDCPCGSEDDDGHGGGSGHGHDKEENSGPGAPLSIAGGPLDNSQTTQPRTEINPDTNIDLDQNTSPTTKTTPRTQSGADKMAGPPTASHDYKSGIYNRHQLRQGLKYLGLSQNAPELKELHDRIDKWDRENAPDAVHKYIIKDKHTAVSFMKNPKVFDDNWMAQVKAKLDEQDPPDEKSEHGSDEEFEEGQEEYSEEGRDQGFHEEQDSDPEDVDEDDMNVDHAFEQGDSEQQTTNHTTIASSHTFKTPRATKSGEKATGAAGNEMPRRSEGNIKNVTVSKQTTSASNRSTKTASQNTSKQTLLVKSPTDVTQRFANIIFKMAEPPHVPLMLKLRLSSDNLRQEQLRIDADAKSKLPEADADNATSATEQVIAGEASDANTQETRRVTRGMRALGSTQIGGTQMVVTQMDGTQMGGMQEGGNQMGTMPVPMDSALDPPGLIPRSHFTDPEERRQYVWDTRHLRPARMKTTPPAALARRRREDAAFEAATQKRLKEERKAREANEEEFRRRREEFIVKDKKARRWAKAIEDDMEFWYKSPLARNIRNGADPNPEVLEQRHKLKQDGMMRGMNPYPGEKGNMMSSEEKEKEIEEMREFLALQAAKGETYFPPR
ncbi:unnamed protein product [Alternaria alternata]